MPIPITFEHGIFNWHYNTRYLEKIPNTITKTIKFLPVNIQLLLAKAVELKSTSEQVQVSCQCKGNCQGQQC